MAIHPDFPWVLPLFEKEAFLTIREGEVKKGTLEIPLKRLKSEANHKYLDKYNPFSPHLLFARFVHNPTARGEEASLDAWTGRLQTDLMTVPLDVTGD